MQRLLFATVLIIVGIAAYMFLQHDSGKAENPIVEAPKVSDTKTQAAKGHIDRLTEGADQPIPINQANNFVTADQLISLPEKLKGSENKLSIRTEAEAAPSTATDSEDENGTTFAINPQITLIANPRKQPEKIQDAIKPLNLGSHIKLQELLDDPDPTSQKVYFIHAVQEGDDEGLWGIIQYGLMRTFTEGLSLPGLENKAYVDIPKEADEKLADKRSSFLGQILKKKVDKTYIYNYEKGILGENPDLIKPGQQLVIVTFTEQELIGIYDHFINL